MPTSTWGLEEVEETQTPPPPKPKNKPPPPKPKPHNLLLSNFILRYLSHEHFLLIIAEFLREAQLGSGDHRNNLCALMALALVGGNAYLRDIHITTSHTAKARQPHTS